MRFPLAVLLVLAFHLFPVLAKAGQDFENIFERLSDPPIHAFSGGLETKANGSVWFRWTAAAGYSDQLEFGDGLETWFDAGPSVYGFGHTVEVKLLDPPAGGGQGQGGGGNGPDVLAIDAIANVFSDGKLLLSFSAAGEPVKVLLNIDFSDMVDRPFLVKTYDRPDPQLDCSVVLFFQTREWLPHFADYALAGLTLSPEAQEIVDAFLALASAIHADLLLPPGAENQTAQSQITGDPGALGFIRVRRNHADLDHDGIADAVEFAGFLGFFDPFSWDTDGDGIPDYLEGVGGVAEKSKPGAGDEDDPNDPPMPPFAPPRYVVYPLGGQFALGSGWTFRSAWVTDTSVAAAIKENASDERHLVYKGTTITELWPKTPTTYPRGKLLDASRGGKFLLDVTVWDLVEDVAKQEYQVADEDSVVTLSGTPLTAAMPTSEIIALPYYAARLAEFQAAFPNVALEEPVITQTIHSVEGISETGNVLGIIAINVSLEPKDPPGGTGGSGPAGPNFGLLLPYFWKTGLGGGRTGSLHEYFTPDSEHRYWTESGPNPPYVHTPAAPNFEFQYFGGLDILMASSQGQGSKIGVAWPGFTLSQDAVPPGFDPHDGSMWGSTVSSAGVFKERSIEDVYDDSQIPAIPNDGTELTNSKWWNLADLTRAADPVLNIPALDGPSFVIRAPDGTGVRAWQAWPLTDLVAGMTGSPLWWSQLEPKHLANTGVIAAQITQEPTLNRQLVMLLPVEIDIVQMAGTSTDYPSGTQDADFAVVSLGTDPDLASELVVSMPHLPNGVTTTVNLALVPGDGGLTFENANLSVNPGSPNSTKIWGATASTAENSSKISLEFVMSGASVNPVIKEDLTIIDGVKISFEGTFYSPVDVRDYYRRPHDGVTPYPPGHHLPPINPPLDDAELAYTGILAQDTGDFSSSLVFWDGDQNVTKRSWSPPVEVSITKVEALSPAMELTMDVLSGGELHVKTGRFLEHQGIGNDLIKEPDFELRKSGETTGISSVASTFDVGVAPGPQPGPGVTQAKALADLNAALTDPGKDELAQWIRDTYTAPFVGGENGFTAMAPWYETASLLATKWENPKFTHTKGTDFKESIAAKALGGWQQRDGVEKISVYFELSNFYEWELVGDVREGSIETK